jgi:hypothetical protein
MNGWIKVVVVMFCFTFDMKIMNFLLKLYIYEYLKFLIFIMMIYLSSSSSTVAFL